jgi:hypothetical protein
VGAVIETTEDLEKPGLVTVILTGDRLLAFHRDIVERTEPVIIVGPLKEELERREELSRSE